LFVPPEAKMIGREDCLGALLLYLRFEGINDVAESFNVKTLHEGNEDFLRDFIMLVQNELLHARLKEILFGLKFGGSFDRNS
jgi:hypothetical protein